MGCIRSPGQRRIALASVALVLGLSACRHGSSGGPEPEVNERSTSGSTDPAITRTLQLLERVVRIDSGGRNEAAVGRQLGAYLETAGVEARFVAWRPGRSSLVARIGPDRGAPIVLASHLDAFPADRRRWPEDAGPFSGARRDGRLVGRGLLSGKGLAVAHAFVLSELAQREADLVRPVVLVAAAGALEPEGGAAATLRRELSEVGPAMAVLTPGGYTLTDPGVRDRHLHLLATGDPGWAWVDVTAVGDDDDPASVRLARYLPRLVGSSTRIRVPPSTFELMRELGSTGGLLSTLRYRWSPIARLLVVPEWRDEPLLSRWVAESVELMAIESGIDAPSPARARARLRARLMPGTSAAELRRRLRSIVPDPRVFFTLTFMREGKHPRALPQELQSVLTAHLPPSDRSAAVAPALALFPSLSPALRDVDAPVVGYWPISVSRAEVARVERPEESVELEAYVAAARRLRDVVLELSRGAQ